MKTSHLRSVLAVFVSIAALGLAGCGGSGFGCADKGKCANDPATTQSEVNQCNAALGGACGNEFRAVGSCAESTQQCDSNGMTDTTHFQASCSAQFAALAACCNAHTGTPGC